MRLICEYHPGHHIYGVVEYQTVRERMPLFIGAMRLNSIFDTSPNHNNPQWKKHVGNDPIRVIVHHFYEHKAEAMVHAARLRQQIQPVASQLYRGRSVVQCVTTGQYFINSNVAAEHFGIHPSAMSNHLNGRRGYATIHSKEFRRVDYDKQQAIIYKGGHVVIDGEVQRDQPVNLAVSNWQDEQDEQDRAAMQQLERSISNGN